MWFPYCTRPSGPDADVGLSTSQFDEEFAPVIEQIEQANGHCLSQEEEETA